MGAASKPRGIVDLSTVTDVADGSAATGRPNSIKLSTATGHICYLCESETSQVDRPPQHHHPELHMLHGQLPWRWGGLYSRFSLRPSPELTLRSAGFGSQVEWYSALEGAVAKIIKLVAGVDEEQGEGGGSGGSGKVKSWAEELERTYASAGASVVRAEGGSHDGPLCPPGCGCRMHV